MIKLLIQILIITIAFQYNATAQYKSKTVSRSKVSKPSYNKSSSIQKAIDSAQYYIPFTYKRSFEFIEEGFKKIGSEKQKFSDQLAKLYELLGDVYINLNQYDLAIENIELSLQQNSNSSIDLQLKLFHAYLEEKQFKEASELKQKLAAHKDVLSRKSLKYYEYAGDLFFYQNNYDKALTLYKKGLLNSKTNDNNNFIILFDNKIATVYIKKGDYNIAEDHLNNSIKNVAKEPIKAQILQADKSADFYNKNKQFDKEISIRCKSIEKREELSINEAVKEEIQVQNLKIADAYMEKEEFDTAIPYLEKIIVKNKEKKDLKLELQATKKLSKAYERTGNFDLALTNYKNYIALTDRLYQSKEKEINDAVILTKDLAEKQKRIDVLELDRELNDSKSIIVEKDQNINRLTTKKQNILIYSLLGGLLLSLMAIFFFYKNIQQRKIANNLLSLKALKSQMNPHFIFNALNSVNNYIALNDERKANKYLTDFSMLMRMVLDVSEKDFISLKEEIKLLELYISLEHARFEDKFDFKFVVDEDLLADHIMISPMLVQPYVENAVWHGMRYRTTKGLLEINISKKDNEWVEISISDNGVGRKKSMELKSKHQLKSKSKGMLNTKERIRILNKMYKQNIELNVSDLKEDGTGTKVILKLPIGQKTVVIG